MHEASSYNSTSVRAIICRADQILVEWLESKAIAFLPGGTVETGEDLIEALTRELTEEILGADFKIGLYRGKIGHRWIDSKECGSCLNHFYEVQLSPQSDVSARESGRCLRWIALSDPMAQALQPPSLRALLTTPTKGLWNGVDTPAASLRNS